MFYFYKKLVSFLVFLPINLISMRAPLLSLALRMFGNALSGYFIIGLVYAALEAVSSDIFWPIFDMVNNSGLCDGDIIIAPIIIPISFIFLIYLMELFKL